ncbi:MAG: acyl-CoA dehydrogenase family protein, partial [Gammaproteobacteria bacterium]|nr:acyl-CoA dehydrogenase family protein [Gammaproteobacteria bacterium]
MDFSFTAEELQFRDELRHWLQDKLPEGWGETVFEPEDEDERAHFRLDWEKKLYAGGWSAIEWPEEYGGRAATPVQRTIYAQEMARARAPEGLNVIGRNLTATTLFLHGTEAQRQRFLPKIRSAEEVWC